VKGQSPKKEHFLQFESKLLIKPMLPAMTDSGDTE